MRRWQKFATLFGFLFFSLGLVQCGTYNDCVQYYNAIYNKQGPCPGDSSAEYSKKAEDCAKRLEECSEEDRQRARDTTACIEKLDECTNALSHGAAVLGCHTRLNGVSRACAQAFARP